MTAHNDGSSLRSSFDEYMHNYNNGYRIFDTDEFQLSPDAIALVNQVLDYIEENPDAWDQSTYGNMSSPSNCFMGLVIRISGTDVADRYGFGPLAAAVALGMGKDNGTIYPTYEYDRIEFVAEWKMKKYLWELTGKPTIEGLREQVSIAFHHDFRKPTLNVGNSGPFPQAYNEI